MKTPILKTKSRKETKGKHIGKLLTRRDSCLRGKAHLPASARLEGPWSSSEHRGVPELPKATQLALRPDALLTHLLPKLL